MSGHPQQQQPWELIQQKTFTKWLNNQLVKSLGANAPEVHDVATDLASGVTLIQLLAALTADKGVKAPRYNANPKMRVHALDNLSGALSMLTEAGLSPPGTAPHHFADGDRKMILGFIWFLIVNFQMVGLQKGDGSGPKSDDGAKAALLAWCRDRLAPYQNISIDNFTTSWQNGLAFAALVHSQNPNLINYNGLDPARAGANCQLAFQLAHKEFHIPKLLDVEDVVPPARPDERSIMTYVSEFSYHFGILGAPTQHMREQLDVQAARLREREEALAREHAERMAAADSAERARLASLSDKERALELERQRMAEAHAAQMRSAQEAERLAHEQRSAAEQLRLEQEAARRRLEEEAVAREAEARRNAEALAAAHGMAQAERERLQAEQARLRAEADAARRHLEEEKARQAQALAAQSSQLESERRRMEEERRRLQQQQEEMQRMAQEQARQGEEMRRQHEQQQRSHAMEAAERDFADRANGADKWLSDKLGQLNNAAQKQIYDAESDVAALKACVSHGDDLIKGVREAGGRCMQVGLTSNRFTTVTLKGLEEKVSQLKSGIAEQERRIADGKAHHQQQQQQQQHAEYSQAAYPTSQMGNMSLGMPSASLGMPSASLGMPNASLGMPSYSLGMPNPYSQPSSGGYSGSYAAPVYGGNTHQMQCKRCGVMNEVHMGGVNTCIHCYAPI